MKGKKSIDRVVQVSVGRSAASNGSVRELRERFRLSQRDVADAIGVSPAAVSRWEAGDRVPRGASAEQLQALISALEKTA